MKIAFGESTGIRGTINVDHAIIFDDTDIYEMIRNGLNMAHEYRGLPGFAFVTGRLFDTNLLIGVIPPYPQAVVEAVSELYVFGVRHVIMVIRGYKAVRSHGLKEVEPVAVQAAIPLDSFTSKIAPVGVPLLASQEMLGALGGVLERIPGIKLEYGTSITIDSPRMIEAYSEIEKYIGLKRVYCLDSVSATLYALQYKYERLKPLVISILTRTLKPRPLPIETDLEEYRKLKSKETEIIRGMMLVAVETLKAINMQK